MACGVAFVVNSFSFLDGTSFGLGWREGGREAGFGRGDLWLII